MKPLFFALLATGMLCGVSFGEAFAETKAKAERGDAEAQLRVGIQYYGGIGVAKNLVEAVKWTRKAAEQGNTTAQYQMGVWYTNGQGMAMDKIEGLMWFRKAAEQGDGKAQVLLGVMYASGKSVEKDLVEAYAWFNLASVTEPQGSEGRNIFEEQMTPSQIADAQKRTKELAAMIEAKKAKKAK